MAACPGWWWPPPPPRCRTSCPAAATSGTTRQRTRQKVRHGTGAGAAPGRAVPACAAQGQAGRHAGAPLRHAIRECPAPWQASSPWLMSPLPPLWRSSSPTPQASWPSTPARWTTTSSRRCLCRRRSSAARRAASGCSSTGARRPTRRPAGGNRGCMCVHAGQVALQPVPALGGSYPAATRTSSLSLCRPPLQRRGWHPAAGAVRHQPPGQRHHRAVGTQPRPRHAGGVQPRCALCRATPVAAAGPFCKS